jgi:hypothetical protein
MISFHTAYTSSCKEDKEIDKQRNSSLSVRTQPAILSYDPEADIYYLSAEHSKGSLQESVFAAYQKKEGAREAALQKPSSRDLNPSHILYDEINQIEKEIKYLINLTGKSEATHPSMESLSISQDNPQREDFNFDEWLKKELRIENKELDFNKIHEHCKPIS